MPQGPRRGWVRAAFTGLGVVLCTGLVGCMNGDKDKFPPKIGTNTKQPGPGCRISVIPGQPEPAVLSSDGATGTNTFQPTGGLGANTGRMGTVPNNSLTNPAGGFGAGGAGGVVPSAGPSTFQPTSTNNFGGGLSRPDAGAMNPGAGNGFAPNTPVGNMTDLGPIPPGRPDAGFGSGDPIAPPVPPTSTIIRGGN